MRIKEKTEKSDPQKNNMEEENLKSSIKLYKDQLQQIDQALQTSGESADLAQLKADIEELIKLTEESLLSLKKSKLLQSLDANADNNDDKCDVSPADMDLEYAAFKAMLEEDSSQSNTDKAILYSQPDLTNNSSAGGTVLEEDSHSADSDSDSSQNNSSQFAENSFSDMYNDIVGMRCRAPYTHEWGSMSYCNAMIAGIECGKNTDEPKVRVLFCNPTHNSMLPCKFYLEGKCRFSQSECRYSHGCLVDVEEIREFEDPDYSLLTVEGKCLARYEDDIWYKATVTSVDLEENQVTVSYDSYKDTAALGFQDVIPLESFETRDSDSDDNGSHDRCKSLSNDEESDEEDTVPVFLWQPKQTTAALGQWEEHTRGIGSKLMLKMGYIHGQGLGKNGEGRAEPVPIQVLPAGKSLDKIMELKEMSGDMNMFDAMKKLEKKKKKAINKQEKSSKKTETPNVFDFINKKLGGKKGNLSDLIHRHPCSDSAGPSHGRPHHRISEHDLHKKSDRNLGVQLLKTSEEIRSVMKELSRLQQSLTRNETRDKKMAEQVRHKIGSLQNYLCSLKDSEKTIESHQKKRNDHKKLAIF
ncbi:hypothetical protein CHS0354_015102 [Potamilus streckersoni]|uniref:Zinc finger CCCH-type with G patch domain-containing protein n=1 Tax=Potamilus streckersoni TaxID=2493646 RepID=A0AAE0TIG9_9BIVA|nr:hypothetical protein CHS0354_015102 [Potamilus streckersoni]